MREGCLLSKAPGEWTHQEPPLGQTELPQTQLPPLLQTRRRLRGTDSISKNLVPPL